MRGLTIMPPRLGFPLLLSTILSIATVDFHFLAKPSSIPMLPFIPAYIAANSGYFLVRYLQRCVALKRAGLAGGDTWPTVPLFPGKIERVCYPVFAFAGFWAPIMYNGSILPKKSVTNMQWPEDGMNLALVTAYYLGLAVSLIVSIQLRRVRKAEDKVLCEVAHEMHCRRCSVAQAALGEPQDLLFTNIHHRVADTLAMSMILSLTLCCTIFMLAPAKPDILWALIAAAAVTAGHRLFFLVRAKFAGPVDWPSARLFRSTATRMSFHLGNFLAVELPLFLAIYVLSDDRLAWSTGALARVVLIAELLALAINFVALIFGLMMSRAETRAICMREGHRWKCARYCSFVQDLETSAADRSDEGEKGVIDDFNAVRRFLSRHRALTLKGMPGLLGPLNLSRPGQDWSNSCSPEYGAASCVSIQTVH